MKTAINLATTLIVATVTFVAAAEEHHVQIKVLDLRKEASRPDAPPHVRLRSSDLAVITGQVVRIFYDPSKAFKEGKRLQFMIHCEKPMDPEVAKYLYAPPRSEPVAPPEWLTARAKKNRRRYQCSSGSPPKCDNLHKAYLELVVGREIGFFEQEAAEKRVGKGPKDAPWYRLRCVHKDAFAKPTRTPHIKPSIPTVPPKT